MEKKSSINDVHKVIQKDLVELHKTLSNKLGDRNPFAKFSIGGGFYLWSDSRCQWTQMISASSLEQSIVRAALLETKKNVAAKLGEKTTEALFTIPDDSYIYYSNEGDEIEILITGWGFKKPVRVAGKGDTDKIKKDNPVNISFIYDGQALPNYEFGIQLPKQIKPLKTNTEGVYHFDNLRVQEKFKLVDFVTGQEFLLTVIEGQSQYNYDVTVTSCLNVYAKLDNSPLSGESVEISYNGRSYNLTTDQDGKVSCGLPFYEGELISASMRDQSFNEVINKGGNQFVFQFESPKQIHEADIEVSVIVNDNPVYGKDVTITYAGNTYTGKTNEQGTFLCHVQLEDGEICSINVPEYDPQSRLLEKDKNVFIFEKKDNKEEDEPLPPPMEDPILFNPHIFIQGDNGFIGSKYPIKVTYNGNVYEYVSDENGIVPLPEMEDGKIMKVQDCLNPDNTCEYKLDANQLEYIFHVPYEPNSTAKDIKVTILDINGNPMKCDHVCFQQETPFSEYLANLDADGSTYFAKDSFRLDTDINVSIIGSDKKYDPIVFTLEEDEFEYVLQEKDTKSSWWKILLQILAVLATIIGALMLWPFVEGFVMGMFDIIYN